ncbi:hypothetical protein GFS24_09840 [Chitinophaga sp. SYP-B3965]|uniref:hypothetical protein n=1 Tax=Chitinophaga sp. SYP-B3965 TaxID=2663120 RepID=UPI001299B1D6|nr:hypothetical protein [Chitinophaga sp. SYP-B3965]MRG45417.1 hypothetical protein [Chitinophaga sp. SYP-B3965]
MKSNKLSTIAISRITGIIFLLLAAGITLFIPCLTKTQLFIIYTLVGLSIALLLIKSADKTNVSYKVWNISIVLVGGVALPFILFFTNPVGTFKPDDCFGKRSLTVFVHGKKGRQDMVLRQKGYVIMDIGGERKKAAISENGEAYFQNLRLDDEVRLNIDFSEPYTSLSPDSVYKITEEGRIYLTVALQGIDKVDGVVLHNDMPLESVLIKINSLSATTDSTGHFLIRIPDSLQSNKYTVWFYKKGFKTLSKEAYPQTGIPLGVVMEK